MITDTRSIGWERRGQGMMKERAAQPEISKLEFLAVFREEAIRRFDITVDQASAVDDHQRLQQVPATI